jgi:hypothetical protein
MPVEGYNAYLSCLEFDELPKLKVPRHTLLVHNYPRMLLDSVWDLDLASYHIANPGFAIML